MVQSSASSRLLLLWIGLVLIVLLSSEYQQNSLSSWTKETSCVCQDEEAATRNTTDASKAFDAIATVATSLAISNHAAATATKVVQRNRSRNSKLHQAKQRKGTHFDLSEWKKQTTGGGLNDVDRMTLANLYQKANSVFEWGLGESTRIANHMGVPRYSGVDSDAVYVAQARAKVSTHFRFFFADIGETGSWGYPQQPRLPKNVWNYQFAPLMSEPLPFDVYMVDGRYRVACVVVAFLHASSRMASIAGTQQDGNPLVAETPKRTGDNETIVLLHDCHRPRYQVLFHPNRKNQFSPLLVSTRDEGGNLCLLRRHPQTSDNELQQLWRKTFQDDE